MRRTLAGAALLAAVMVGGTGHAGDTGEIAAAVEVHATTVERRLLEHRLTLYGEIAPEPAGAERPAAAASLSPVTEGLVTEVRVVEGQPIEQGSIVVRLDGRRADATLKSFRAEVRQATAEAERQQRLVEQEDSSVKQREIAERKLAEAQAALAEAQTARDYLEIRSPLSGTVLRVDVRQGEVVHAGDVLVEIADLDRLVADVRIPASELSKVQIGQAATVQVAGRETGGRVVYVGARVDPASGSGEARIELESARGFHPGDFARARVVVEARPDALAVPSSAVVYGADGTGTIAVLEGGRARLRPVEIGIEDGDWVEIEGDGIRAGTPIVGRETYGLPDDTPVRVVAEPPGR